MAMDWKSLRPEHVAEACELVASGGFPPRATAKGIFVRRGDERLSAKQVLRLAYCIANGLPLSTYIDFASGQASVSLLRGLGFDVEHVKHERATSRRK